MNVCRKECSLGISLLILIASVGSLRLKNCKSWSFSQVFCKDKYRIKLKSREKRFQLKLSSEQFKKNPLNLFKFILKNIYYKIGKPFQYQDRRKIFIWYKNLTCNYCEKILLNFLSICCSQSLKSVELNYIQWQGRWKSTLTVSSQLLVESSLLDLRITFKTLTPAPLPSPTIVGQCDTIGVVPDVHGSSES